MIRQATGRKGEVVTAARVLLSKKKTYAGRQRNACVWGLFFFRLEVVVLVVVRRCRRASQEDIQDVEHRRPAPRSFGCPIRVCPRSYHRLRPRTACDACRCRPFRKASRRTWRSIWRSAPIPTPSIQRRRQSPPRPRPSSCCATLRRFRGLRRRHSSMLSGVPLARMSPTACQIAHWAWLDVRLDSRPKYYTFQPYRTPD